MDAGPNSSTTSDEKAPAQGLFGMFSGIFGGKQRQEVSEDEIRTMVADNDELADEEKRMIHEVMDLGDATAAEVMTPRVDMMMVGADETVRQAIDRMRGTGYSRLPVYREDDDDIIGIVRYKDLIDPLLEDKEGDLAADYAAEVSFVPESKSLLPLLNEMQTNRQQMVIVVDEYGGTAGLITIEDIVEEIVGEIVDETDFEDADIKRLGPGSWCVKGSCPVDDAAEAGFPVKAGDDYETVAGWLMAEFDCVPQLGDEFEKDGFAFKVRKVRRRRISELLVTKREQGGKAQK